MLKNLFIVILLSFSIKSNGQSLKDAYIDDLSDTSVFDKIEKIILDGVTYQKNSHRDSLILKCGRLTHLSVYNIDQFNYSGVFCSLNKLNSLSIQNVENFQFAECDNLDKIDSLEIATSTNNNFFDMVNKLKSLKYLSLQGSFKGVLDFERIFPLIKLKTLNIGDIIVENAEFIGHFREVEYVSLTNNRLKSFILSDTLNNLMSLNLDGNHVKVYNGLLLTPNLIKLSLKSCNLKKVPLEVSLLKKIESLDVSDNKLENYTNLNNLHKIKSLNISNNSLTIIPATLFQLNSLTCLNLSSNPNLNFDSVITELVNRFPNLKELDISSCRIDKVPNNINKLKILRRLNISANMLSDIQVKQLQSILPSCEIINVNQWIGPSR